MKKFLKRILFFCCAPSIADNAVENPSLMVNRNCYPTMDDTEKITYLSRILSDSVSYQVHTGTTEPALEYLLKVFLNQSCVSRHDMRNVISALRTIHKENTRMIWAIQVLNKALNNPAIFSSGNSAALFSPVDKEVVLKCVMKLRL
jgi:hypothetical protein